MADAFGAVAGIASVVAFVLVSHYAARRVRQGDTRYLWIVFSTQLLAGAALLLIALNFAGQQPLAAIATGALGLLLIVLTSQFVLRLRRALRSAPAAPADFSRILVDQLSDYMVALVVVGFVIGIGGGLLLVVLAILGRAG